LVLVFQTVCHADYEEHSRIYSLILIDIIDLNNTMLLVSTIYHSSIAQLTIGL